MGSVYKCISIYLGDVVNLYTAQHSRQCKYGDVVSDRGLGVEGTLSVHQKDRHLQLYCNYTVIIL